MAQQHVDFAPRQRSGAQWSFCQIIPDGKTHHRVRESTVPTRPRTIRLLPISKSKKCIESNTYSVCRRGENKSGILTEEGDT